MICVLHKVPEGSALSQSPLRVCCCPFGAPVVFTAPCCRASSRHKLQSTLTPAVLALTQCCLLFSEYISAKGCSFAYTSVGRQGFHAQIFMMLRTVQRSPCASLSARRRLTRPAMIRKTPARTLTDSAPRFYSQLHQPGLTVPVFANALHTECNIIGLQRA